jgi:hypothetical protein
VIIRRNVPLKMQLMELLKIHYVYYHYPRNVKYSNEQIFEETNLKFFLN